MTNSDDQKSNASSKMMKYGMMACCAVMILPVAGFLIAGGTIAGLVTNASLFAPIALCVGAHVLMFKVMGKSCHSSAKEAPQVQTVNAEYTETRTTIPNVAR